MVLFAFALTALGGAGCSGGSKRSTDWPREIDAEIEPDRPDATRPVGGNGGTGGKADAASSGETDARPVDASPADTSVTGDARNAADGVTPTDGATTQTDAGGPGGGMGVSEPAEATTVAPTNLALHTHSKVIQLDTSATGANVSGDVNAYPVAVLLNAANFDFTQAQASGEDIRFATMAGALLPYAIELWDAKAKQAALWVKVDVKGNDATQAIVMYWGNATATSAARSRDVFSASDGFVGVYHLNQDGSETVGGYRDVSGNGANGTGVRMTPGSLKPGRIGNGTNFDNPGGEGKNQWIKVDGGKSLDEFNGNTHPLTVTVWTYVNALVAAGNYETLVSKSLGPWTLQRDYQGKMEVCTTGSNCAPGPVAEAKKWVHYTISMQGQATTWYMNGQKMGALTGRSAGGTEPMAIGNQAHYANNRREWDGIIDEVRVLSVAKDANWAKLEYESQREGSTFLKFGASK